MGRAYSLDVPGAIAWAEDGELGLAIPVVIRRDRDITIGAILSSAYSLDVPRAIAWAEDGRNDITNGGSVVLGLIGSDICVTLAGWRESIAYQGRCDCARPAEGHSECVVATAIGSGRAAGVVHSGICAAHA